MSNEVKDDPQTSDSPNTDTSVEESEASTPEIPSNSANENKSLDPLNQPETGDADDRSTDEIKKEDDIEEDVELWDDLTTKSAIEALLFVADDPLTKLELSKLVVYADKATINRALTQLMLEYAGDRGIHLVEIDGGLQFRTNADLSEVILRMYEAKPLRLSKAILETLAIVAYQQPVTKARADEIRGVDCSGSLKKLINFELVAVIGRADDIGRPNLYATTTRFLEFFGMNSITDMPTLEEFEVDALELVGEDLREFLPEDNRASILADHVEEGLLEREERPHELGESPEDLPDEDVPEEDSPQQDAPQEQRIYSSSAANDDGVAHSEEE